MTARGGGLRAGRGAGWLSALVGSSALIPGLAATASVLIYLAPAPIDERVAHVVAAPLGFGVGVVAWMVFAFFVRRYAKPQHANIGAYGELVQRYRALVARLGAIMTDGLPASRGAARAEAVTQCEALGTLLGVEGSGPEPDVGWVVGTNYITCYRHLHRAEEALLDVEPVPSVIAAALFDRSRLDGSQIDRRGDLLARSQLAVLDLLPDAHTYVGADAPAAGRTDDQRELARAVIRSIRRTINEFRDDRSAGLVRLRRRLTQSVVFSGLTGYVAVALALHLDAPEGAVVAGAAYYLVGAIIGLFQRLHTELGLQSDVEDYGLSTARLIHIPLVSGLAAVAGVVVIAMLGSTPLADALTPAGAASASTAAGAPSGLAEIFDLARYPLGLVLAAVFGLTPGLLLDRLQKNAEQLKSELRSSEAASDSPKGTDKP